MNLVFSGSNSIEIEFNVDIAGTASSPNRVMAVLEQDGISLSFPAKEEEGMWRASVSNLGQVFKEGLANFSINVILNDKLFIPLKNQVTIQTESLVSVEMASRPEPTVQPPELAVQTTAEQVKPEVKTLAPTSAIPVAEKPIVVPPVIKQEQAPAPATPKFALLRSIEPVKKPVQETKNVVEAKKPSKESVPAVTSFKLKRTRVVTE
jgi:hypothetical protein